MPATRVARRGRQRWRAAAAGCPLPLPAAPAPAAAPQTPALGPLHPQPSTPGHVQLLLAAPCGFAVSSSACFVPVVPLAPDPAPSLGDLMGPTASSTEAWRLGDCTDNVAGMCRCHPKVGLNPLGRGERQNEAGWMPRTGSGAGGTLKGALRKEEGALDRSCSIQRDPRKGQQPQHGADGSVSPGRVPWSGREEKKLACNCQAPAAHAASQRTTAPLFLGCKEKARAVPALLSLSLRFLPAQAACQRASVAGQPLPRAQLCPLCLPGSAGKKSPPRCWVRQAGDERPASPSGARFGWAGGHRPPGMKPGHSQLHHHSSAGAG